LKRIVVRQYNKNAGTFIAIALLISFFSFDGLAQSKHSAKPNIVFILADDLGYGDLGVYGQKIIKTPNIDRLAREGKLFTQFYAGTTVCAPSRSSLLTGKHTGHTYIRGNKEIVPEGQEPLADSVETYARLLQKAGYATGAFGKWGLGMVGTSGDPARKGFDYFFGYNCQRQSHRYYPTHLWDNDRKVVLEGNDLQHKAKYAPELIQEKTLAFIDRNKDKPFFLFVPSVLPHAELQGPDDEFFKLYKGKLSEKPFRGNDYGPNATIGGYASEAAPHATYAAMVSRLDDHVGQILQKLERRSSRA
jgi:arylsulfatase A-like enzyme